MSPAVAVPTLDELARDPKRATGLPRSAIAALLVRIAAVQGALAARLAGPDADVACAPEPSAMSELVDVKEMARRLDVHESWVRTEQRAGRIPCVKVGRYPRFHPAEVEAAIAQRPTGK